MKILILVFIFSHLAISKCMVPSDEEKIKESKIIFSGKIRRTNVPGESGTTQIYCEKMGAMNIPLRYLIEPLEVLKGKLKIEMQDLSFTFSCNKFPKTMSFKEGSKYIFSVKMRMNREIFLSGHTCESWGWRYKELAKIKKLIAK